MSEIVRAARGWLGTPYVHQASTKGAGTDCLGLVRGVWRECLGCEPEAVPAYTADWSEPQQEERLLTAAMEHMLPVDIGAELRIGQCLLFRMRDGSVAKHLGNVSRTEPVAAFIHAYSGRGVVESALSHPWSRRIVARFEFPARAGPEE